MLYNPRLKNQVETGIHYKGECPFCHNESEKFYFNKNTGLWDCKNCQMAGNWFQYKKYLKELLGITIQDVEDYEELKKIKIDIKKVNTVIGIEESGESTEGIEEVDLPDFLVPLNRKYAKDAYFYFVKKRNFDKEKISRYFLSYCKNGHYFNRIIIPVIMYGKLFGFLGRWVPIEGVEEIKRKYKNSWDTKFASLLWNYDKIKSDKPLVICEGVLSGLRVGRNVTATFGKKISKEQIKLLEDKDIKEVVLLFDSDAKNEIVKYAGRLTDSNINIKILLIDGGDPDELNLNYNEVIDKAENFVAKKYIFFNLKKGA